MHRKNNNLLLTNSSSLSLFAAVLMSCAIIIFMCNIIFIIISVLEMKFSAKQKNVISWSAVDFLRLCVRQNISRPHFHIVTKTAQSDNNNNAIKSIVVLYSVTNSLFVLFLACQSSFS